MRTLRTLPVLALALFLPLCGLAQDKDEMPAAGMILQFNGKPVEGVEANTKVKEFKAVFEKELAKIADSLKTELKVSHWYTVINGGAVRCTKGDEKTFRAVKSALEKLPYVKLVEYDRMAKIGLPKIGVPK